MLQGMIALEIGILAVGWLHYVRKKDPECQLRMDKRVYSYIIIYNTEDTFRTIIQSNM